MIFDMGNKSMQLSLQSFLSYLSVQITFDPKNENEDTFMKFGKVEPDNILRPSDA